MSGKLSKTDYGVVSFFGLCAAAVSLIATSRYGPAVSQDSVHYMSTALNLASGKGFVTHTGGYFSMWPPLYPSILAALKIFGLEPMIGARLLNAVSFAVTVSASGVLFSKIVSSKKLILLGTLVTALSYPLLYVSVWVWSESLFVLLVTVYGICVIGYCEKRDARSVLVMAIITALAFLQRYMGATLVVSGAISIAVIRCETLKKKLRHMAVFLSLASLPAFAWMIRNYMLVGEIGGPRELAQRSLINMVLTGLNYMSSWALPIEIPFAWRMLILAMLLSVGAVLTCLLKKTPTGQNTTGFFRERHLWIFAAAYLTVLYVSVFYSTNTISNRYLCPVYVFVMGLLLKGADGFAKAVWGRLRGRFVAVLTVSMFATLWFSYAAANIAYEVVYRLNLGAGGFNTKAIVESPIIGFLKQEPNPWPIYTNISPDALYFLCGKISRLIPERQSRLTGKIIDKRHENIDGMGRELADAEGFLVWFDTVLQPYTVTLGEIEARIGLKVYRSFEDGRIYKIIPRH